MKTVSGFYLDGIKEAREIHTQHGYFCPKIEYEMNKNLARSHNGAMKDFFKGQDDFLKNQVKKGK